MNTHVHTAKYWWWVEKPQGLKVRYETCECGAMRRYPVRDANGGGFDWDAVAFWTTETPKPQKE